MARKPAEVDYYDVQGDYGGIAGWESVTAEETYKAAKESRNTYEQNDRDAIDFRIVKVYKSGRRVVVG